MSERVSPERLGLLYWADAGVGLDDISNLSMTEEEFRQKAAGVTTLEMFLNTLQDPEGLIDFCNLRELSLHVHVLPRAVGLTRMTQLQRLCMTDVGLQSMVGIQECTALMHLDLSQNCIPEMDVDVLSRLTNLRCLWLNQNSISRIQGLKPLNRLNTLWLARNAISCICDELEDNAALTDINLAATAIGNFRDIPKLSRLRLLSSLALGDAHFGDSPVCALCNYQTYILFHVQQLNVLDAHVISDGARHMAEATYMKKKMYYNMRIKTIKRNTSNVLRKVTEARQAKISQINLNVNVLVRQKKDVERELQEIEAGGGGGRQADQLTQKHDVLERGIRQKTGEIAQTNALAEEVQESVVQTSQSSICRLLVELETGGNIRLEDGKPSDVWFSSCVDLVKSRFAPTDFAPFGLDALRVTRVTRVHNRQLRNRFEDKLDALVNTTELSYKRSLEYLFFAEHPSMVGELTRVMEEGFRPADEYCEAYGDAAVPLSNSLIIADTPRLRAAVEAGRGGGGGGGGGGSGGSGGGGAGASSVPAHALTNKILITKVFLAKCTLEKVGGSKPVRAADYDGFSSAYRAHGDDGKQRQWFVFEPALVLPEYVVEYEYIPTGGHAERQPSPNQLLELSGMSGQVKSEAEVYDLANLARPLAKFAQQCALAAPSEPYDDVCTIALNMPPTLPQRPKASAITPVLIAAAPPCGDPALLTNLNLHGHAIRIIENLERLSNLRVLVLCFNELQKIEGLGALRRLQRLELGFNLIKRIEGLEGLVELQVLELNNNLIYRLEDVSVLRQQVPQLSELTLHNNAVCEHQSYRLHVVVGLPSLQLLDGVRVDASERERAAESATAMTPALIRAHAYARRRWSYSLRPDPISVSHAGDSQSHVGQNGGKADGGSGSGGGPSDASDRDTPWWEQVQELELNHQQLRKLQDLDNLLNLRRASFCNNELAKIEGLDRCVLLEELSLEDNRIHKLENLHSLVLLTKLDLGKNRITRIEGLETLTRLAQLSLEDNEITSLGGLALVGSLMEVYIGNNRVAVLKEVQHLKGLQKLIILDLAGNPLCETPDYRHYTVYQLRKLKVLDGVGIEVGEQSLAKEKYAGKLTTEALVERLGHNFWEHVHELDLCRSKLRELDALHAPGFVNLRELTLDSNLIPEVFSLPHLPALTTLRLNHNLITTAPTDARGTPSSSSCRSNSPAPPSPARRPATTPNAPLTGLPTLTALEVLHLGYNQITDIPSLKLSYLRNLRVLHLQGNEITRVDGLQNLSHLRELILDRNRIRQLDPGSLLPLLSLRELRMDENGLRSLDNFAPLPQLLSLSIVGNRVSEIVEIEKLESLHAIVQIAVSNNPFSRKQLCRPSLIRRLPTLTHIDGREVTAEERERSELVFSQDLRGPLVQDSRFLATKVPLKLTSMNFEMMSGLSALGIGPPASSNLTPNSAGAAGGGLAVGGSNMQWQPMSAPHDDFFLPSTKQRGGDEMPARGGARRANSRNYDLRR